MKTCPLEAGQAPMGCTSALVLPERPLKEQASQALGAVSCTCGEVGLPVGGEAGALCVLAPKGALAGRCSPSCAPGAQL